MHGRLQRLLSQAIAESSMYRVVRLSDAHQLASRRLDAESDLLYGIVNWGEAYSTPTWLRLGQV